MKITPFQQLQLLSQISWTPICLELCNILGNRHLVMWAVLDKRLNQLRGAMILLISFDTGQKVFFLQLIDQGETRGGGELAKCFPYFFKVSPPLNPEFPYPGQGGRGAWPDSLPLKIWRGALKARGKMFPRSDLATQHRCWVVVLGSRICQNVWLALPFGGSAIALYPTGRLFQRGPSTIYMMVFSKEGKPQK